MQSQKSYTPINCWKCQAQNNAARSSVCRVCGSHLKMAESIREDRYSDSITEHSSFKGFIWSALVIVVAVTGLMYFYGQSATNFAASTGQKQALPQAAAAKSEGKAEVTLPADSWHNKSWWSYLNRYPSAKQILQKNNEVNGTMPPPEVAKTISISGKMAHAFGKCFVQTCLDEMERLKKENEQKQQEQLKAEREMGFYRQPPIPRLGEKKAEPEMSDSFASLSFTGIGSVEIAAKIPDKSIKKARASMPRGPYSALEISEVFNGQAGKKTINYFDSLNNVVKSDVEIMAAEKIAGTKAELESLWRKDFSKNDDLKLRGIEKLNDRVVFVVTSKNKEGDPETHYFDSVTGFLVKMDNKDFSVYLEDYRLQNQAKIPFLIYYRRAEPGGYHSWIKFEVSEWKLGIPIDDSVFDIPAS